MYEIIAAQSKATTQIFSVNSQLNFHKKIL